MNQRSLGAWVLGVIASSLLLTALTTAHNPAAGCMLCVDRRAERAALERATLERATATDAMRASVTRDKHNFNDTLTIIRGCF